MLMLKGLIDIVDGLGRLNTISAIIGQPLPKGEAYVWPIIEIISSEWFWLFALLWLAAFIIRPDMQLSRFLDRLESQIKQTRSDSVSFFNNERYSTETDATLDKKLSLGVSTLEQLVHEAHKRLPEQFSTRVVDSLAITSSTEWTKNLESDLIQIERLIEDSRREWQLVPQSFYNLGRRAK